MTDKELRKLSRAALIELLISEVEENERLREKADALEAELQSRSIDVEKAGTMADAALSLNEVFTSVDKAAAQYLENVETASTKADAIIKDANAKAAEIIENANLEALDILYHARRRAQRSERSVQRDQYGPRPVSEGKSVSPLKAELDDQFKEAFKQFRKHN